MKQTDNSKKKTYDLLSSLIYRACKEDIGVKSYWGLSPNAYIRKVVTDMREAYSQDIEAEKATNKEDKDGKTTDTRTDFMKKLDVRGQIDQKPVDPKKQETPQPDKQKDADNELSL